MPTNLEEYIPGTIWLCRYPIGYFGVSFDARMSVIRLAGGRLVLHSPCEIDATLADAISALGRVAAIVAPGNFHHLHVASAQTAFPDARTFICPGVEKRAPSLVYDQVLGDDAPELWSAELDQVLVRGNSWIWEVAFFHRATKTLIVVDLVENFTDRTPRANWHLKLWMKLVFRMWDNPKPAPEYQLGWRDKAAARASLARILEWDFRRVILSHGDLIEDNARQIVEKAWRRPLAGG